jgi:hypothetical protein
MYEETTMHWEDWVTRPIRKYPIAPRQARVLIEAAKILALHGIPFESIFDKLICHNVVSTKLTQ